MGNGSLLDGVRVEEGSLHGIFGDSVSYALENCTVQNNVQDGIYGISGNVVARWCKIRENGHRGMYHSGSEYSLTVENCKIYDNQHDGIYTEYSTSTILNSSIYQNGLSSNPNNVFYGISLINPGANTEIRNNTIVYNTNEGIRRSSGSYPEVRNCILFGNNADDNYVDISGFSTTWYCCLTDPNHLSPPITDPYSDGYGNIKTNPSFAYNYPVYGYFHLNWDSPCRDRGDSWDYPNEEDMDGRDRVYGSYVDIGADEIDCEDTSDPNDWNGDGTINYGDFTILSRSWLSCDPNVYEGDQEDEYIWYTEGWGFQADRNNDSCVDLDDLELFLDNWLWEACWRDNYMAVYCMMGGSGGMMMAMPTSESLYSAQSLQTESVQSVYEPSLAEQTENIKLILKFLDTVLEEDNPENEKGVLEIKAILEDWLDEIKP